MSGSFSDLSWADAVASAKRPTTGAAIELLSNRCSIERLSDV
jgi:hypothetical protein